MLATHTRTSTSKAPALSLPPVSGAQYDCAAYTRSCKDAVIAAMWGAAGVQARNNCFSLTLNQPGGNVLQSRSYLAPPTASTISTNKILLKNISVMGLHLGAYAKNEPEELMRVWNGLFELFESKKIRGTNYT
ncbi:MAG: hypothetical protein EOO65_05200, partial [Methanosarcinales archaeon]